MNEAGAIRLCLKHRDPAGFEFLVTKYRREAYVHAIALLGNRADAEDACQESFLRAFVAIPKLAGLYCFYPWFYRILRNCCLNMLDRRKTVMNHARENGSNAPAPHTFDDPASFLAKREEEEAVWRALNGMNAESREILSLKYIQGKSYNDIVRLLEIPRGTVMSRLFHARQSFRESYAGRHAPRKNRTKGEMP